MFNGKVILKSQQRFKNNHYKVYTEEVNKMALCSDDDKRLQTFDGIETYPYGTNAFRVCKSEVMVLRDFVCSFYGEIVLNNKDKCFHRINDQF